MKKILLVLLIFSFPSFGEVNLSKYGNSIEDLIPKGWNTLSSAFGDLNKDGMEDLAFVIQGTDPQYLLSNEGLGTEKVNLNTRVLAIYFKDAQSEKFEKQVQSNEFILLKESPTMDEPFEGIEITKNGVLKINFRLWSSAGTWSMSNDTYQFRYQNNHFTLIGYDSYEGNRASGDTIDYSMNFLTRKMSITQGNFSSDKPYSVEWKNFKLDKLKTLESLKRPYEWEFMGIRI